MKSILTLLSIVMISYVINKYIMYHDYSGKKNCRVIYKPNINKNYIS